MTVHKAGAFIRAKVRGAIARGCEPAREEYGVVRSWDGLLLPDPASGKVCGLGACLIGEHSVKSDLPDAIDDALRQIGIDSNAESDFIVGWDDGRRNTPWQRLGDDLATEFIGPRELFSEPVDTDDWD